MWNKTAVDSPVSKYQLQLPEAGLAAGNGEEVDEEP